MNKLNLHNACKKLCWQTYQEGNNKNADGWQYVNSYSHQRSGYYSEVYRKGEDVILVIKGTDLNSINEFRKDGYSDIQNYGDLSQGVKYKKEIFEDENAPLFKLGVEYNDYNPDEVFDTKNRVLYRGEINPDNLVEGTPLFDLYVDNMIDKNPMPTKKEVDKRTRIGELIYVEEYTRSDGTKVSGCYRAYPRR